MNGILFVWVDLNYEILKTFELYDLEIAFFNKFIKMLYITKDDSGNFLSHAYPNVRNKNTKSK